MSKGDALPIPARLAATCRGDPDREAWLARLPQRVRELSARWSLELGAPYDGTEGGHAWVAPALLRAGGAAVLKLGMPHMEGEHEIAGLRFWDGNGTVRVLAAAEDVGAMLLERCEPGTPLRAEPGPRQDRVIAGLLKRLWREPPPSNPFRRLEVMTAAWADDARRTQEGGTGAGDPGRTAEALTLLEELARSAERAVLLATDLHAGNVLRSQREPWLVIDPKPFVGDPAYDATQHLLNSTGRLRLDPHGTVQRFADLLGVDAVRVGLGTFARLAIGGRGDDKEGAAELARALSV